MSLLNGGLSEEARKYAAWIKAALYPGDQTDWRRIDCDGNIIHWEEYGKLTTNGWEIDHATPLAGC